MIEELSYVWITDNKSPEAETCMNRFNVSNADQLSDEYCVGNCSNCLEGALNWFHPAIVIMFYRKKNRRLSSIFDSCCRKEVSNFCLRQFGKVEPFCEPLGWRVDINNINSLDNSGSNETMQKVLASIV